MGLLTGSASFTRFHIDGQSPAMFSHEHLSKLFVRNIVDNQDTISMDGSRYGWSAGEHMFDREFTFEKNVLEDALFFQLCVETNKAPAEKFKAYYATELAGLAKNNPSGHPSALNRREAKEAALDRVEQEAKDGRFKRRKLIDVIWDRQRNEVFFGSTSSAHAVRMATLFEATFDVKLEAITAESLCERIKNTVEKIDKAAFELTTLSPFIPSLTPPEAIWDIPMSLNFSGNEFLMWLWFQCEDGSETIELPDVSDITFFLSKTLTLECPRGSSGKEVFTHEGPTRLPEAMRGIRGGKLPRRCGITFVRHDRQFELVLSPETWAIGSAKIPKPEEDGLTPHARLCERVERLRDLAEGLDLTYQEFCEQRFSDEWSNVLPRMQRWLERETVKG